MPSIALADERRMSSSALNKLAQQLEELRFTAELEMSSLQFALDDLQHGISSIEDAAFSLELADDSLDRGFANNDAAAGFDEIHHALATWNHSLKSTSAAVAKIEQLVSSRSTLGQRAA